MMTKAEVLVYSASQAMNDARASHTELSDDNEGLIHVHVIWSYAHCICVI